jgi:hypothetical protein
VVNDNGLLDFQFGECVLSKSTLVSPLCRSLHMQCLPALTSVPNHTSLSQCAYHRFERRLGTHLGSQERGQVSYAGG